MHDYDNDHDNEDHADNIRSCTLQQWQQCIYIYMFIWVNAPVVKDEKGQCFLCRSFGLASWWESLGLDFPVGASCVLPGAGLVRRFTWATTAWVFSSSRWGTWGIVSTSCWIGERRIVSSSGNPWEGIAATVPASSLGVEADPESQREEEKISTAVTKEKKTESKEVRDEKVKKEKKLKSTDRRCRSRSSRKQAPRERRRYRESYSSSHQRRRRGCSRSSDQVEVKEEPPEAELTRRATEAVRGDTEGAERRTPRPEERKSARTEDWLRSWAWSSTRAVDCWRWASPTRTSSSS